MQKCVTLCFQSYIYNKKKVEYENWKDGKIPVGLGHFNINKQKKKKTKMLYNHKIVVVWQEALTDSILAIKTHFDENYRHTCVQHEIVTE